jgi:hypothetical protein
MQISKLSLVAALSAVAFSQHPASDPELLPEADAPTPASEPSLTPAPTPGLGMLELTLNISEINGTLLPNDILEGTAVPFEGAAHDCFPNMNSALSSVEGLSTF